MIPHPPVPHTPAGLTRIATWVSDSVTEYLCLYAPLFTWSLSHFLVSPSVSLVSIISRFLHLLSVHLCLSFSLPFSIYLYLTISGSLWMCLPFFLYPLFALFHFSVSSSFYVAPSLCLLVSISLCVSLFLSVSLHLCLPVSIPSLTHPILLLEVSQRTNPGYHLSFPPPRQYGGQEVKATVSGSPPTLPPNPKTACYCCANSHSRLHLIRLICCPRAGQSWRKPQSLS